MGKSRKTHVWPKWWRTGENTQGRPRQRRRGGHRHRGHRHRRERAEPEQEHDALMSPAQAWTARPGGAAPGTGEGGRTVRSGVEGAARRGRRSSPAAGGGGQTGAVAPSEAAAGGRDVTRSGARGAGAGRGAVPTSAGCTGPGSSGSAGRALLAALPHAGTLAAGAATLREDAHSVRPEPCWKSHVGAEGRRSRPRTPRRVGRRGDGLRRVHCAAPEAGVGSAAAPPAPLSAGDTGPRPRSHRRLTLP